MIRPSTFSIVAYDHQEQALGIAVASKFLGVGSVVPWAQAGAGAVATQSYANTSYGPRGIDLMERGLTAQETLDVLLRNDSGRELRQVGIVDHLGNAATFTGSGCFEWAGGLTGNGFAVQGNILAGEDVVHTMADTFEKTTGPLRHRLLQALLAGDHAGGDRRGRQSAALLVVKPRGGYGGFNDRWVDYRVDDDPQPIEKLQAILELHDLYFSSSPPEDRIKLQGEQLKKLQKVMALQGYYQGEITGIYDKTTRSALEAFTGSENFEERVDLNEGLIDRPVFDYLLKRFGKQE